MPDQISRYTRNNRGVAVVGTAIGLLYLIVGVVRHQPLSGAIGLGIMLVYVGLMYGLWRRSEPAQLLSGQTGDERQAQVMLRASALTGQVLVCVIVAAMLVCLAADSDYTAVFSALAAVAGVGFVAAVAWYSRHL